MAVTSFASRIATLKARAEKEHKRSESNLAVWIASLYELLGVRRLSRIQIAWCRTRIIAIRDKYPDDLRVQKMLEDLDRRADEAWSRHLARIKKREEARAGQEGSTPLVPTPESAQSEREARRKYLQSLLPATEESK